MNKKGIKILGIIALGFLTYAGTLILDRVSNFETSLFALLSLIFAGIIFKING